MAMSIPNPKRASAISFLSGGDNNHNELPFPAPPGSFAASASMQAELADQGSDWRTIGTGAFGDSSPEASDNYFDGIHRPHAAVHVDIGGIIASPSTLSMGIIRPSSSSLAIGAERTPSAPVDSSFAIWGHDSLGSLSPPPAAALGPAAHPQDWDPLPLPLSPPGLVGRPLSSMAFGNALAPVQRPLSTPVYPSSSSSSVLDRHLLSSSSGLSSGALEALNGISSMSLYDHHSYRPGMHYPTPALGIAVGEHGLFNAAAIERTASAPALIQSFDGYVYPAQQVPRTLTPQMQQAANGRISPVPVPANTHGNGNSKMSLQGVDDRAIENVIASNCQQILLDAMYHSLKAVELANTLRARVGTELLAMVREKWGGLLCLLERHSDRFLVERIPKNDRVSLVNFANTTPVTAAPAAAPVVSKAAVAVPAVIAAQEEDTDSSDEDDLANASRCLHVGNVPMGYTEVQLMREFEKYGQLEGLKLISQKNNVRRFAFVTFKTINQAMAAKHNLSKLHPWKSAISFAHKDMVAAAMQQHHQQQQQLTHGHGHGHGHAQQHHHPYPQQHMTHNPYAPHHPQHPHHGQQQQAYQQHGHHQQQPQHGGAGGGFYGYKASPVKAPAPTVPYRMQQHQQTQHIPQRTTSPMGVFGEQRDHEDVVHHAHKQHMHAPGPAGTQVKDPVILQRLCDDTYVPTQPWPVDVHNDLPLLHAVQQQLVDFNGTTTISKLRGYLKHRLGVVDNIKSVPLKALLLAYPQCFLVDGNIVSMKTAGL